MSDDNQSSLLIVGGTKAGKSHYGAQLLRRLEHKRGALQMVGAPSDLTPFQEVLDALSVGRAAPHTPSGTYKESIWNVRSLDGVLESQLVWPDYAGEQIEAVVEKRRVPEQWVQRIGESNGWLFFIRLKVMDEREDVFERPRDVDHMQADAAAAPMRPQAPASDQGTPQPKGEAAPAPVASRLTVNNQAGLVELLQALLFVKQRGTNTQVQIPALVIVLSCYDDPSHEQNGQWEDPASVLREQLPLVSQYVDATWRNDRVEIIGLSALGKPLQEDIGDEEFMDAGPESQGWCITKGGAKTDDLTLPVYALMEKVQNA